MKTFAVIPVLLMLLPAGFAQVPGDDLLGFDCRRYTDPNICGEPAVATPVGGNAADPKVAAGQCLSGGDGSCTCNPEFEGIQCGNKVGGTCTNDCGAEGTCLVDAFDADTCFCNLAYEFGTGVCEKRVRVTCAEASMTIFLVEYGGFNGKVNLLGGTNPCDVTSEVAAGKDVKYDGTTCAGMADITADTTKTITLKVTYADGTQNDLDRIVEYQCFASADESIVNFDTKVYKTNEVLDTDILNKLALGNSEVDLTAELWTGGALVDPMVALNVGVLLTLKIILAIDSYGSMQLSSLSAGKDANIPPSGLITLIAGGCPEAGSALVLRNIQRTVVATNLVISVDLVSFKYDLLFDVFLSGTVKLCIAVDDPNCFTDTCPFGGGLTGLGKRKRRDVVEDSENVSLNISLTVVDPSEIPRILRGQRIAYGGIPGEVDSCLQNVVFLVPLAILAVLLLLAMIMAIYFCLKLNHTRKMMDEGSTANMAYKS